MVLKAELGPSRVLIVNLHRIHLDQVRLNVREREKALGMYDGIKRLIIRALCV